MDEGTLVRLSPLRPGGGSGGGGGGGLNSSSSGKLTPRDSPSSRRLNSGQTPRREARSGVFSSHCLRSNRIVLWFGLTPDSISSRNGPTVTTRKISSAVAIAANRALSKSIVDVVLAKNTTLDKNKPSMRSRRSLRRKRPVSKEIIPKKNTTYVFLVGPFGFVEDSILEWSVGSTRHDWIFHELSMKGRVFLVIQVLETDYGETREIVEHNITDILHPLGLKGREKVERMYLKKHTIQKFGEVLYKCMRIK
ncbi:hypothetical protein MIMGU_mgv11b020173mg [Erythranthe guttata]|uniref:Uncharacterized protein n=1 Tax=Erythranthe guttata TaxID=4155 RepID=A0A022Q9I6_ERYGU|nr:hypothetical protein MIMGU_mgv11b020173mg [Erythranthe guttata]